MPSQRTGITEAEYAKAFSPSIIKSALLLIKGLLRHPILFLRTFSKHPGLEGHFDDCAHKVSFGRSDHPLDDMGPMQGAFTAIPKLVLRHSQSILEVTLARREENAFLFQAEAYNIFNLISIKVSRVF